MAVSPLVYDPDAPIPWRPLVVVLPFASAGPDPGLVTLGRELADSLREQLQRDAAIRSILISSDFLAKAPAHALRTLCGELRIGHIINGRCHGTLERPSLYLELTDSREWSVHWSRYYRGEARSLLAMTSLELLRLTLGLRRRVRTRHA